MIEELKNDKDRMAYVRDQNNWDSNHTGLLETRCMYVGTRTFIRIIGKVKGEYDPAPKIVTVDQFEMVNDKEGCHLEHRNNGEIVKAIRECK